MSIVMGIDQHRAQITAEWIELETGEIGRARVRLADRAGVRRFVARFSGRPLEVATEATTGWRFLVEELRAAGAEVHLAEPAETAALRGNKKHAKSDRADARHLRELLLAGRVPESWIPPDHILDLRARVRLRHTLISHHSEWQQRIQAVLYHHGCAQRRGLMVGDGRDWLAVQPLPETAREQITVALTMIDALDVQIAPIDRELRAYARVQTGCKALIDAYYGIGELCAVTIVSELGDCRRFANSRDAVRYGGIEMSAEAKVPQLKLSAVASDSYSAGLVLLMRDRTAALNGQRGSARLRMRFCIRLGCRVAAIVGRGARRLPYPRLHTRRARYPAPSLSTWCGAYSVGLDVVHPHLPAARVRVTLVDEAIRASAGELGATQMPDAAEHAGDPPSWPADRILDLGKRARPVRHTRESVQQVTHQVAAPIMETRDLFRIIHRILGSVLCVGSSRRGRHLPRVASDSVYAGSVTATARPYLHDSPHRTDVGGLAGAFGRG